VYVELPQLGMVVVWHWTVRAVVVETLWVGAKRHAAEHADEE